MQQRTQLTEYRLDSAKLEHKSKTDHIDKSTAVLLDSYNSVKKSNECKKLRKYVTLVKFIRDNGVSREELMYTLGLNAEVVKLFIDPEIIRRNAEKATDCRQSGLWE